jgi:hypothetical protein
MQTDELTGSPLQATLLPNRPGNPRFRKLGFSSFFESLLQVDASSIDSASSFFSLQFPLSRAFSFRGAGDLHPAISGSPLVERRVANTVLLAQLVSRQFGCMLLQRLDDLLLP